MKIDKTEWWPVELEKKSDFEKRSPWSFKYHAPIAYYHISQIEKALLYDIDTV